MKHDVIRLLNRCRDALLRCAPHEYSVLIGDLKLLIDKLESLREVDPFAPISELRPTAAPNDQPKKD